MELQQLERINSEHPVNNVKNELAECLEIKSRTNGNTKTYFNSKRMKRAVEDFSNDIKPFEEVYLKSNIDENDFKNFDLKNVKNENNISIDSTACQVKEEKYGIGNEPVEMINNDLDSNNDGILTENENHFAVAYVPVYSIKEEEPEHENVMTPRIVTNEKCAVNKEKIKETRDNTVNETASVRFGSEPNKVVKETLSVGSVKITYGCSSFLPYNRSNLRTYSRVPQAGILKDVGEHSAAEDPLRLAVQPIFSSDDVPLSNSVPVRAVGSNIRETNRIIVNPKISHTGLSTKSGCGSVKKKDVIDLHKLKLSDISHTEKSLLFYPFLRAANIAYSCVVCKRVFNKRSNLTEHVGIHENTVRIKVNRLSEASEAIDVHNSIECLYVHGCLVCDKYFESKRCLITHLANHDSSLNFKCEMCNRHFYNMRLFVHHLKTHNSRNNYKCEFCGQSFPFEKVLIKHIIRNHNNSEHYKCFVCNVSFTRKQSYSTHIKNFHCGGVYNCRACGATFSTEHSLHRHLILNFIHDKTTSEKNIHTN